MNQVPNIISTKDLDYLSDMFNWNFTLSKKALMYSKNSNLENIKNICEKVSLLTSKNCHEIINILGGNYE
jgi:hypothetical protein